MLLNFDLGRYAALASTLHLAHSDLYGFPSELFKVDLDLGLRWNVAHEADDRRYDNWLGTVISHLETHQIDYDLADTHVDLERLQRYPLVFVPTVDFMDPQDLARLLMYAERGGQVVMGPGLPYLDPALCSSEVAAKYIEQPGQTELGEGSVWWIEQGEISATIDILAQPTEYTCEDTKILLLAQTNANYTLLFIANPTSQQHTAEVCFAGNRHFKRVWGEACSCSGEGAINFALEPYTVQIWEVLP